MPEPRRGKTKRSCYLDIDVVERLRVRGERIDRSIDWQMREILRAFLDAEEQSPKAEGEAAA